MDALELAATARLADITARLAAAVVADPVGEAVNCWLGNLDWYTIADAYAEPAGDVLAATISYGPDCTYRFSIPLADLPADPTARHEEVWRRLDDFASGVDALAAACPDHTPADLDLAVRSARAARLADRYIHERDPATLADLFATLHRKS